MFIYIRIYYKEGGELILFEWIYNKVFLERQETLFIVCIIILALIIIATVFMARKELRKLYHANK